MLRLLALIIILLSGGCSSVEGWSLLQHEVDVERDTLSKTSGFYLGPTYSVDLQLHGVVPDCCPYLAAIITAFDAHPGLELQRVSATGPAARKLQPRRHPTPAPNVVALSCRHQVCGSPGNWLVGFPGMLPFVPIWRGYSWTLSLEVWGEVLVGETRRPYRRTDEVEFRERNSRRSALFHLWPMTGFYGTQFLAGIVLAPTMCFYDTETTPVLLDALGARFGRTFANDVYREIRDEHLGRR